jgi:hypothetical protein
MSWIKQGCYADTGTRAIPNFLGGMHLNECEAAATAKGYNVIGMQAGDPNTGVAECWAGLDADFAQYGLSENCTNDIGGGWAQMVYKYYVPLADGGNWNAKGCYADQGTRAIPYHLGNFTLADCETTAKQFGYNVLGMQNGDPANKIAECWAGSDSQYDQYGSSQNCGVDIGGPWANTVYKYEFPPPPAPVIVPAPAPADVPIIVSSGTGTAPVAIPMDSQTVSPSPIDSQTVSPSPIDSQTVSPNPVDSRTAVATVVVAPSALDSIASSIGITTDALMLILLILIVVVIIAMGIRAKAKKIELDVAKFKLEAKKF